MPVATSAFPPFCISTADEVGGMVDTLGGPGKPPRRGCAGLVVAVPFDRRCKPEIRPLSYRRIQGWIASKDFADEAICCCGSVRVRRRAACAVGHRADGTGPA